MPVSGVDKKISQELQRQFKPTVIVVNKWDLVDEGVKPSDFHDYLAQELRGVTYAPVSFLSAKTGKNVFQTLALTRELEADLAILAVQVENIRRVAARYRPFVNAGGTQEIAAKPYFDRAKRWRGEASPKKSHQKPKKRRSNPTSRRLPRR